MIRYFYTAVLGFAGGIFLASFLDISPAGVVMLLVLSLVMAVVARRGGEATPPLFWLCSLLLLTSALGIFRLEWADSTPVSSTLVAALESEVTLTGTIIREPDEREYNTHLYLAAAEETFLVIANRYGEYQYGDVVTVTGKLTEPREFETDLGRTFNYPGYLKARDVNFLVRYADVSVRESGNANPVLAGILKIKHQFMERLEALLPEPQVGLAEGLLLGVKRALGAELEAAFRETGIIHIVVLSGYNVMLVVAFVTYVTAYLIPVRGRLIVGLIAIAAFAFMVGLSATVLRASIMAAMVLIARATNRIYVVLRALMLAGVIMLVLNPYLLAFDTGFQLSFVATLGLILIAPQLEERLSLMPSTIGLREFLTATVATQIAVTPLLLYQIGEFSVVAVIVNLLVLPMVPIAMLLTFITGVVGFVSTTLALPVAYLTHVSLSYILLIATWFAALPFASYVVPSFPFFVVPLSYALMGYVWWRYGAQTEPVEDEERDWTVETETAGSHSDPAPSTPPIFVTPRDPRQPPN